MFTKFYAFRNQTVLVTKYSKIKDRPNNTK